MKKLGFLLTAMLFSCAILHAQVNTLTETFNTASPTGWTHQNLSNPVGSGTWTAGSADNSLPGFIGAGCAVVNYSSTNGTGTISNWYISPVVNIKNGAVLSFYTRTASATTVFPDRLEVRVSTSGSSVNVGASATDVGDFTKLVCTVNPNLSAATSTGGCGNPYPQAWTQYSITLSGVGNSAVAGRIAFRYYVTNGGATGTNSNIIGLDELSYNVSGGTVCGTPAGINVSAITQNSATLNWSSPSVGSANSYDVYYSTASTDPTSSTTPSLGGVTGSSVNLTGLSTGSRYYVWLRSNCSSIKSSWTSATVFSTLCSAASAPYTVNLSGVTAPMLPLCMVVQNVNNDPNTWQTLSFPTPPAGVTNPVLAYMYNTANAANDWLFSRPLQLTAGYSYTLNFKYNNDGTTPGSPQYYPEKLKVMYGTTASAAGMTLLLADYPTVANATVQTSSIQFTPPASGTYYIGFHAYSAADMDYLFISDISLTEQIPAPVVLANFRGERKGNVNLLSWVTTTEVNNAYFSIERSVDGKDYSTIGNTASRAENGNSTVELHYAFTDKKPFTGNNYYRLKQVDKDGKFEYSTVVLLKHQASHLTIGRIYPNPVTDQLHLLVSSPGYENISLVISDLSGKLVIQKDYVINKGDNTLQLNTSHLAPGNYFIRVMTAGNNMSIERFIKF